MLEDLEVWSREVLLRYEERNAVVLGETCVYQERVVAGMISVNTRLSFPAYGNRVNKQQN